MSRHLLVPFVDRAILRRVLQRIDQILGYPRDLDPSEYTRGPGRHSATPPRTETAFGVRIHANTGPVALRRLIAVTVDDGADRLGGRFIEHNSVRKRLRDWVRDQGWQIRDELPDPDGPWTAVEPRDGADGSATGVPIPEGEE